MSLKAQGIQPERGQFYYFQAPNDWRANIVRIVDAVPGMPHVEIELSYKTHMNVLTDNLFPLDDLPAREGQPT